MMQVSLDDRYRAMPGIGFLILKVEAKPAYEDSSQESEMEKCVTAAAKRLCGEHANWRLIPGAQAYIDFYRSMGLKPNRVSTPFRQAMRFTKKDYRSISPLIDTAMLAEYGTGVSFQVLSSKVFQQDLKIQPTSCQDRITGADGNAKYANDGEIGTFSGTKLLHCPSLGLSPEVLSHPSDRSALVRLMVPPGLAPDSLKQASRCFFSKPGGVVVNQFDQWSYPNE